MRTCGRRLEFDAAHRVMGHETKCRNLHGHRYCAHVEFEASALDQLGRVIDFGAVKSVLGHWIDERWDHGTIVHEHDREIICLCEREGWRVYTMAANPTAENLAAELHRVGNTILAAHEVRVVSVRLYETPNCWATYP